MNIVNIEADERVKEIPTCHIVKPRKNTPSKVKKRMRKDAEAKRKLATMENGSTTKTEQTPKVKRKILSRKIASDILALNTTSESENTCCLYVSMMKIIFVNCMYMYR